VAYRRVAKRKLCKQRPLLVKARNIHATIEERCFLCNPCRDVIRKKQSSVDSEFSSVRNVCEDRSSAREAEISPLLKAVNRERLMKAQRAGKGFRGCCGDFLIVEIGGGAVTACSFMPISPFANPNAIYSHTHYVTLWITLPSGPFSDNSYLEFCNNCLCSCVYTQTLGISSVSGQLY
jgi:hypothetical protein